MGGCLGALLVPCTGFSQGFYFDANAGVAFAEDVELRRFVFPTPGAKFELDEGPRVSAAGGFRFNDFIALQAETGIIANEVKGSGGDAFLSHVPVLLDFVLRYDRPNCRVVPYIGIGAGGDVSILDLDHVRGPSGIIVDGNGSDFVFAWQAFAGARYKFNQNMSIGAGYKFYSAESASWDVDNLSGDIKTGRADVHSVGVDFNMTF